MSANLPWSKASLLVFGAWILLGSSAANAQWSTYPSAQQPAAAPQIAAPSPPLQAAPPAQQPDSMATQPFSNAPVLPQGYQPAPEGNKTEAVGAPPAPVEPVAEPRQPDPRTYVAVKLQGLDKVTARRQQFEALMGTVTSFGNLEIVPRACWQSPAEERPESAALLEIWQWKPGEKPSFVFFGWMFSSSPALSSLEHPIYDITVLKCIEEKKPKEKVKKDEGKKS